MQQTSVVVAAAEAGELKAGLGVRINLLVMVVLL
jgi:hypothetical protein